MAEAIATFAALSSVLQIIDFTAKVSKQAKRLLEEAKSGVSANNELDRLAAQYQTLATAQAAPARDAEGPAVALLRQECLKEAESLVAQLQRLRITPGLKTSAMIKDGAGKVVRAMSERKDIDRHLHRLQELSCLLGTKILERLMERHEHHVVVMLSRLDEIDGKLDSMSDDAKLRRLTEEHDKAIKDMNNHLLASLRFEDLDRRRNAISQSYPNTYRWTVTEDVYGLRPWLRDGTGVFWIRGKAGSGKSTLMKYLAGNIEVRTLLLAWSRGSKLVHKCFYFWYLGSALQKSVEGLLRSILYQILVDSKDLLPVAFPEQYTNLPEPGSLPPWTQQSLKSALEALASHEDLTKLPLKYCFFIDGLDEYQGNVLELIGLVRSLAANKNIKICVSSRPWNAFRDAFETQVPNLCLEHLSSPDIHTYVDGSIRSCYLQKELDWKSLSVDGSIRSSYLQTGLDWKSVSVDREVELLVNEIVTKAEGVFLWVFLVVRSVVAGIAEGDRINMLRQRVEDFPSDLEQFFRDILDRADPIYRHQSAQALLLAFLFAQEDGKYKGRHSWADYWLVHQDFRGLSDPSFAYKLEVRLRSSQDLDDMMAETQRSLGASCKDLLVLNRAAGQAFSPFEPNTQVEFLHRTVYEFLQIDAMQTLLRQRAPAFFSTDRIFHLLNLARLTIVSRDEDSWKIIDEVSRRTLTVSNPDLCNEYLGHFEQIVLHHRAQLLGGLDQDVPTHSKGAQQNVRSVLTGYQLPAALAPLIAFQKYQFVISFLDSMVRCQKSDELLKQPGFNLHELILAAYGSHPLHCHPLSQVHTPLIEILLKLEMLERKLRLEKYNTNKGTLAGTSPGSWSAFIVKWAATKLDVRAESSIRRCWTIAKLIGQYEANIGDECWGIYGGVEVRVNPVEFLVSQVPPEWLREILSK